jgi:hypothetical protein
MCWWPNLASLEKPDYPVWKIRVSDFPSFRIGSKNELNMKIWRSKYVWSMKKERRNIKEPTHVLTTNFDILWKPEHPFFTVVRWSIFPNGVKIYIFHKLDHASMFFRLCMCFSENLVEFHSRNKEVFSNYNKMNSNQRSEAFMMKPSSRWSKWVYGTHDLELGRGSYGILKMLQAAKPKVPVFTDQTQIWVKIVSVFG